MKKLFLVLLSVILLLSVPVPVQAAQSVRVNEVKIYSINAQDLKIKWKCIDKVKTYDIFCSTTRTGGYVKVKTVDNLNKSKKLKTKIKGLQPETKYYFKIRAVSGGKKYKCSVPVMVITRSLVPENNRKYVIFNQLDSANRYLKYPYNNNRRTIGTSGCGVCSSLMVIRNTTNYCTELKDFTNQCLATDCRLSGGSSMRRIAEMINMFYSTDYAITDNNELLKEHLEKGYMATAHVGKKRYFSSLGGHFVTVAGVIRGETPERDMAIILDPSFTQKKYNDKKRVKLGIEYTPDGIVLAPFNVLLADCKDECYILFMPEAKVEKDETKPFIPTPFVEGENGFNK